MKKSTVFIILGVLALVTLVLALLNRPDGVLDAGRVEVYLHGAPAAEFDMEQVRELSAVQLEKEITSSSLSPESGLFTAAPLRELLDAADPDWAAVGDKVVTWAEDGFISAFSIAEVAESDNVLIAYAKDGRGLGDRDSGGSGPFRILVRDDPFGYRCTRWLARVEVQ